MRQYVTHMCVHVFQHDSGRKSNMLIYVIMISSRNALFDATMSDSFSHLLKKKRTFFLLFTLSHRIPFFPSKSMGKNLSRSSKESDTNHRENSMASDDYYLNLISFNGAHTSFDNRSACVHIFLHKQNGTIQFNPGKMSNMQYYYTYNTLAPNPCFQCNNDTTANENMLIIFGNRSPRGYSVFFIWIQHLSITFLFHFFFLSFINPLRMSWPALKEKWAKPSNIAWKKIMRICTWIYFHSIHYLIKMYNLLT